MAKPLPIVLTICGASGAGKTCLLQRLVNDTFTEEKIENDSDFVSLQTTVDGIPCDVSVIERGNDAFMKQASTDPAARGDILYYVYNTTDKQSYEDTYNVFKYFVRLNDSSIMYLVASSTDCGKREITMTEGKASVKDTEGFYAEVSCKTGDGVKELLTTSIKNYLNSSEPKIKEKIDTYKKVNKIKSKGNKKKERGSCVIS
ncbi:Ras family protein [Entamoeba marina]